MNDFCVQLFTSLNYKVGMQLSYELWERGNEDSRKWQAPFVGDVEIASAVESYSCWNWEPCDPSRRVPVARRHARGV